MDIYYILGIIISILLTYWGIWHSNKQQKKLNLSLIDQDLTTLINTNDDYFKSLNIEDFQLPTNKNIYYYKGVVMNTGSLDLHKGIIFKPLEISLSDSSKLINYRVTKDREDFNVITIKDGNHLKLEWDLLKSLEKFSIELIFETTKDFTWFRGNQKLHEEIKLDCRIADLESIDRMKSWEVSNIIEKKILKDYLPNYLGYFLFLIFNVFILTYGIKSYVNPKNSITFDVVSTETKEPISITYQTKDTIKLSFGNKSKLIRPIDIDKNTTIVTNKTTSSQNLALLTLITSLVSLLFLFYRLYIAIKEHSYENKMRKILKKLS
jgi:hypothetical protein